MIGDRLRFGQENLHGGYDLARRPTIEGAAVNIGLAQGRGDRGDGVETGGRVAGAEVEVERDRNQNADEKDSGDSQGSLLLTKYSPTCVTPRGQPRWMW